MLNNPHLLNPHGTCRIRTPGKNPAIEGTFILSNANIRTAVIPRMSTRDFKETRPDTVSLRVLVLHTNVDFYTLLLSQSGFAMPACAFINIHAKIFIT
jgi:hypothetical protein